MLYFSVPWQLKNPLSSCHAIKLKAFEPGFIEKMYNRKHRKLQCSLQSVFLRPSDLLVLHKLNVVLLHLLCIFPTNSALKVF